MYIFTNHSTKIYYYSMFCFQQLTEQNIKFFYFQESDLNTEVYLQTKLIAAKQRIAELEELVEGKQLALDAMVQELQFSTSTMTLCKVGKVHAS